MQRLRLPAVFGDVLELNFTSRLLDGHVIERCVGRNNVIRTTLGNRGIYAKLEDELLGKYPGQVVRKILSPEDREEVYDPSLVQVFRSPVDIVEEFGIEQGGMIEIPFDRLVTVSNKNSIEEEDWQGLNYQQENVDRFVCGKVVEMKVSKKHVLLKLDLNAPHAQESIDYRIKIRSNLGKVVHLNLNMAKDDDDLIESGDDELNEPDVYMIGSDLDNKK
jgi:FKBP-type peptidyl-prolyl cis-trans isomerase 2